MTSQAPASRTMRIEAFSDGVFAFSATLLVVSLEVPSSFPELVADLKGFVAFGISFAALVLIWSVHRTYFRRFPLDDRMTVVLNAGLLFVVLFYVYPLKFMADMLALLMGIQDHTSGLRGWDDLSILFMLYSAGFVAVFGSFALMYRHASRVVSGKAGFEEGHRLQARFYARHYGIFVAVGLVSIVLAALQWGLSFGLPGITYVLLGPLCHWHARRPGFDESALEQVAP